MVPGAAPATPAAARPKRRWPNLLLFAAVAYALYQGWLFFKPDACQTALEAAQSAAGADPRRGVTLANQAALVCGSDARADTARKLAQALQAQVGSQGACDRALADSKAQLDAARPRQALRTLASVGDACAQRPEGVARRRAAEAARGQAADKLAQAAEQIGRGASDAAKGLIDAAERLDRDNPDLATTRRNLAASLAVPDPARIAAGVDALLRAADKRDWAALEGLSRELRRAGSAVPAGDRVASDRANAEGLAALRERNPPAALAAFRRAAAADATSAEALNNFGYTLVQTGALAEGARVLMQTLAQAPNRSIAWVNLGVTLALGDKPTDAVNALRLSLRYSINRKLSIDALTRLRDAPTTGAKVRNAVAQVLRDPQDPVDILFPNSPPPAPAATASPVPSASPSPTRQTTPQQAPQTSPGTPPPTTPPPAPQPAPSAAADVGADVAEARSCIAQRNFDCAERAARRIEAKAPGHPEIAVTQRRVAELKEEARRIMNESFR